MMNYKKTKKCEVPSQNLEYDARSKANVTRARNMIATGDKVTVKGTGKARKQTATWI